MPEGPENFGFLIFDLIPIIRLKIKFDCIFSLNEKSENPQKKYDEERGKIITPFMILDAQIHISKVKQICLYTSCHQFILFHMGTGAYWQSFELSQLKYDPFNNANVLFASKTSELALGIIDCLGRKNQVRMSISNAEIAIPLKWPWKTPLPCIMTEANSYVSYIQELWNSKKSIIENLCLASFILKWMPGFGAYTCSEFLHRICLGFKITPWITMNELFSNEKRRIAFTVAPFNFWEELSLYENHYDPGSFSNYQLQSRTDYRIKVLQVYKQIVTNIEEQEHLVHHYSCGKNSIYTPFEPSNKEYELFFTNGKWKEIKIVPIYSTSLGVGIHDWHSIASILKLYIHGDPNKRLSKEKIQGLIIQGPESNHHASYFKNVMDKMELTLQEEQQLKSDIVEPVTKLHTVAKKRKNSLKECDEVIPSITLNGRNGIK